MQNVASFLINFGKLNFSNESNNSYGVYTKGTNFVIIKNGEKFKFIQITSKIAEFPTFVNTVPKYWYTVKYAS